VSALVVRSWRLTRPRPSCQLRFREAILGAGGLPVEIAERDIDNVGVRDPGLAHEQGQGIAKAASVGRADEVSSGRSFHRASPS
jgi:hypothetical protein